MPLTPAPATWLEVLIEHPRGSFIKRSQDGRIDVVSPFPCPYNYGSIPGTLAEDGDPVDAIVLGRRLQAGQRVRRQVVAEVEFIDEGAWDLKLVLGESPLGWLDEQGLTWFFRAYTLLKRALAAARGRSGRIAFLGIQRRPAAGEL